MDNTSGAQGDANAQPAKPATRIEELQQIVDSLKAELAHKNERLSQELLDRSIREAVAQVGDVCKDAWPDVLARGKGAFDLNAKGELAARGERGEDKALTVSAWAERLLSEAPHFFKATSRGAGEGPAGGAQARAVTLTREQAKNPALYRRAKELAIQRGVDLLLQ
jgi:hypothetical protein